MIGIIILAIVQGIAEFLPISSSAHLIIFRDVFNIGTDITKDLELIFDVALHFGTLLAILIYFFKDWLKIIKEGITFKSKMLWYLVIASIPAALAGFLLEDIIDSVIRGNLLITSFALIIVGILLYYVDKKFESKKTEENITLKEALLIGTIQVFALIPGVSRSGSTIIMGRALNLTREGAAKFSFYLSAPIIFGAGLVTLLKDNNITKVTENAPYFVMGVLVSFITGLIVIGWLLKYIKKHDFLLFMWYRIAMAIIILFSLFYI